MLPWQLIAALVGGVPGLKKVMETKAEIAKAKEIAKAESTGKGIPGYSDEFLMVLLSAPLILAFMPVDTLNTLPGQAFLTISQYPDWYVNLYIGIVCSTFGLDKVLKWKK